MTKFQKIIIAVILAVVIFLFVYYFSNVFIWLIFSLFITIIGYPIMKLLSKIKYKKFHIPRWLSAIFSITTIYFLIYGVIAIIVPLVNGELKELKSTDITTISERLEEPINNINNFINNNDLLNETTFSLEDFVIEKTTLLLDFNIITKVINGIGSYAISFFMFLFAVTFLSFFILKDKVLLENKVLNLLPQKSLPNVIKVIKSIKNLISRYLFGLIIQIICIAICLIIGFWIVGTNFYLAILVGLVAALLNIIPYIGPWIGAAIAILLVSISNIHLDLYTGILPHNMKLLIVVIIVQIIDNVVFQPIIYSKSIKAHPIEIFIIIIIAGSIYGIIGMMLAIPTYIIVRVIAKELLYLSYE